MQDLGKVDIEPDTQKLDLALSRSPSKNRPEDNAAIIKENRAYIDGCFDMIHSGHYNAIRQAKQKCKVLVVGVNSDEEILKTKGPSILTEDERAEIIRSCRWVDEVAEATEYSVSEEILDRYNC